MAIAGRGSPRRPRVLGLDLARSVALLGMLLAHFGAAAVAGAETGWQQSVTRFTDGRSMPLFVVLSGCGISLLLARAVRPWRELAGRAALLLVIGLAFEATTPVAVILQAYAIYLLLAVPFNKLATRWLLPVAGAFVAIGAATNLFLNEHLPITSENLGSSTARIGALRLLTRPHVLLADLFFTGSYPVFPSFAFVLVGIWIARHDLTTRRFRHGLVGVGLVLAVVGYGAGFASQDHRGANDIVKADAIVEQVTSDDVFSSEDSAKSARPDEPGPTGWDLLDQAGHSDMPAWMIGATGMACFAIGVCLTAAHRAKRFVMPFVALGQLALTAYVGHLALLRWPMKSWPWGFNANEGLGLTVAGWVTAAAVAWAWRLRFTNGPLEYLLRVAGRLASRARRGQRSDQPSVRDRDVLEPVDVA
jgi:uncharacterized membrane protein YeiB